MKKEVPSAIADAREHFQIGMESNLLRDTRQEFRRRSGEESVTSVTGILTQAASKQNLGMVVKSNHWW